MRKKVIYYAVLLYCIIILQTTLLNYVEIIGIKPNLILVFIICIAIIKGGIEGIIFGFSAGLLQDIVSGICLGPYALLGFLVSFALGGFNERFYKDNIFACAVITFIVSIIYEALFLFNNILSGGFGIIIYLFRRDILIETLLNVALSIPIYILMLKLNKFIDSKEKIVRKY